MMRTLKKSTLLIMVFSIITRLISFFFKIYLSRRVGAEVLGLFQMAASVFGLFCTIAGSGIPLMLSRKTAELSALNGKEQEQSGVMSGALLLSVGISLFLIVGAFLFKGKMTYVFSDGRCVRLFYILLPALLSTILYQVLRGYFMGKGRFFEYSVTELLEEIIKIVACLTFLSNAFIALSESVAITIAFTLTDYIVMTILLILYFTKGGRLSKPRGTKDLLRASIPVTGMRISAGLITSFIAIALPAALVRSGMTQGEATAEYGRAVGMAFSLLFAPLSLTGALSIVILPEAAALAATGKTEALRRRVNESISIVFMITVFFYSIFFVLGEGFGKLLFDDAGAGRFVMISAGMVIPAALSGLLNTTLNSLGEEKKVFLSFLLSSVFLIASVLLLPKYVGIYALSIGECAFHLSDFLFGMVFLWKRGGYDASLFKPVTLTILLTFPTITITKLFYMLTIKLELSVFMQVAIPTLLGSFSYLALLLLFKPIPEVSLLLLKRKEKRESVPFPKRSPDIPSAN